jgi:hypothetical protein
MSVGFLLSLRIGKERFVGFKPQNWDKSRFSIPLAFPARKVAV